MTPELQAALEQVLSLAIDMGDYYYVRHQAMQELIKAYKAEPTEKDKKAILIEDPTTDETARQGQQFYDFAESNQKFAITILWSVYEAAYASTYNHTTSRQTAEIFARDGFDLKRSSLERLLKLFGEMMDSEDLRLKKKQHLKDLNDSLGTGAL